MIKRLISILGIAAALSTPLPAIAQQPLQWRYGFDASGVATATYPGNVIAPNISVPGFVYSPVGIETGSASAASANATAINNAMSYVSSAGGGTVQLPCGTIYVNAALDNTYNRVLVRGCGRDANHNVTGTYGTAIRATAAITVLRHRTVSGTASTPITTGGGFADLSVFGNSLATRLLHVTSTLYGTYDLYLDNSVGTEAALFDSLVEGSTIGDSGSTQHAYVNLNIRQVDGAAAQAANGVTFSGSANANFSFNNSVNLVILHYNGAGILCHNADNNAINAQIYRAGGTGRGVYAMGPDGSGSVGCVNNDFEHLQSVGGAIYAQGTGDGATAGVENKISFLDVANGTPAPTAGTASRWNWYDNLRLMNAATSAVINTKTLIGEDVGNTASSIATICASCSLDIQNNLEGHVILRNSAASIAWGLTLTGQDVRFIRTAGTGTKVVMPAIRLTPIAVASLPACAAGIEGTIFPVTDSNTAVFNATIAAGGANRILAYCNGTNWTVH